MSDSTLSRANATTDIIAGRRASLSASLALVIGFWWAATGLTLAMQRSSLTSVASVTITSLFAVVGVALIVQTRNDATVRNARLAFLGSALVWWWCSALFYAGLGIHINENVLVNGEIPPRSFGLALRAIDATLRPDLIGVVALALIGMLLRRKINRIAFLTFAVFFGTLQTAKLNVFMGVKNASVDWLPEHLAGLSQYFGPSQNSLLLPVTIVAITVCFVGATKKSRTATEPFVKHGYAMVAFLLALAVLEHVMLGVNLALPLWDIFRPSN